MFKIAILVSMLLFGFTSLFGQEVKNIHFEQDGKMINIYYDLTGNENELYNIEIYCSEDDGMNWGEILKNVTGEVGEEITVGKNKEIVWDVLEEREKLTSEISFKVAATEYIEFDISIKELLNIYYTPYKFLTDSNAYYAKSGDTLEIEFDTIQYHNTSDGNLAYAFFNNYKLTNDFGFSNELERAICHACTGYVSIVRLIKVSYGWELKDFTDDCGCGSEGYGKSNPPNIVEIVDGIFFLQNEYFYGGMGHFVNAFCLYDMNDYHVVLSVPVFEEYEALNIKDSYSYSGTIEFSINEEILIATVRHEGRDWDYDIDKSIDMSNVTKVYIYDNSEKVFTLQP